MDLLKLYKIATAARMKMAAGIGSIVLVIALLIAGLYFKHYVKEVDSAIEQLVEAVLATQGVDIDFSAEKKNAD